MSTAISRELAPLVRALKHANFGPSKETAALPQRLLQTIQQTPQSGLRALVDSDEQAAQAVVAKRGTILELTADLQRLQASRLAQDDPKRLVKHRLQLEIVDRLRRIHGVAEDMALSVPATQRARWRARCVAARVGRVQRGRSARVASVAIGRPLREPWRCE